MDGIILKLENLVTKLEKSKNSNLAKVIISSLQQGVFIKEPQRAFFSRNIDGCEKIQYKVLLHKLNPWFEVFYSQHGLKLIHDEVVCTM